MCVDVLRSLCQPSRARCANGVRAASSTEDFEETTGAAPNSGEFGRGLMGGAFASVRTLVGGEGRIDAEGRSVAGAGLVFAGGGVRQAGRVGPRVVRPGGGYSM